MAHRLSEKGLLGQGLLVQDTRRDAEQSPLIRGGARLVALGALALVLAVSAAGCGEARGDADSSRETFKVAVVHWIFPEKQPLGKPVDFVLTVRNIDTKTIPELVVTIRGLRTFVKQQNAASDTRPVWVPNETNYADVTPNSSATGSTFSLGSLTADETRRYVLPLTPIRRGTHEIGYQLAGNLQGTSKIELDDGNPASEARDIAIDPTPVFNDKAFD